MKFNFLNPRALLLIIGIAFIGGIFGGPIGAIIGLIIGALLSLFVGGG